MPEVIDNVKVGEFIKSLLRENNMTQENLSQKLMISKSAVSQNLNGKSSFDMQNLMAIAKLFKISLDDLLNCRKREDEEFVSEYVKFAARGIDEIKKYNPKDLQIQEPDIYGRVLVDYLIDGDVVDVFSYLNDSNIDFVRDYYHRAKEIYLKIIIFMLRKKIKGVIKYVKKYSELNTLFDITNSYNGLEVWNLLNDRDNKSIIKEMIDLRIDQEYSFMGLKRVKPVKALPKELWIESIGIYKLDNVLDVYLKYYARADELFSFTSSMLLYEYYDGVEKFAEMFFSKELSSVAKTSYGFQKTVNLVISKNSFKLFQKFLELRIYESYTDVIVQAIKSDKVEYYDYCLKSAENKVTEKLDYGQIGLAAVKKGNTKILDLVKSNLEQMHLNFLLSEVNKSDIKLLYYLINLGAQFDFKFYNSNTMSNMNAIIEYLLKKEGH